MQIQGFSELPALPDAGFVIAQAANSPQNDGAAAARAVAGQIVSATPNMSRAQFERANPAAAQLARDDAQRLRANYPTERERDQVRAGLQAVIGSDSATLKERAAAAYLYDLI